MTPHSVSNLTLTGRGVRLPKVLPRIQGEPHGAREFFGRRGEEETSTVRGCSEKNQMHVRYTGKRRTQRNVQPPGDTE